MNANQSKVLAARHICEEASKVLSTLRRGPPSISRGSLVHNLRELRRQVKSHFLDQSSNNDVGYLSLDDNADANADANASINIDGNDNGNGNDNDNGAVYSGVIGDDVGTANGNENAPEEKPVDINVGEVSHRNAITGESESSVTSGAESEVVIVNKDDRVEGSPPDKGTETEAMTTTTDSTEAAYVHSPNQPRDPEFVQVGAFAQPFLDIILDPRAAGPQTLIALRSLHRLISRRSLVVTNNPKNNGSSTLYVHAPKFEAKMEPLMRGILECRFEQTDAGADEAVEMAIADLISLIVSLDISRVMNADVIMEAFNTVFVTRNTFVHSPALCYHFEQVLDGMIRDLFSNLHIESPDGMDHCVVAAKLIMEFLVSQLLHTPMGMEEGGKYIVGNGSMEAHVMHDDTRMLCLRLIQTCLREGWMENIDEIDGTDEKILKESSGMKGLLKIVKDDLCLSLLLVGQGIWAYQDPSSGARPGLISMNVLSEICCTLSTLWSISLLRNILTTQFETIFTGFYQRALSLLRRLPVPDDSATFHANQIFDAEVEIILESLVDILSFHIESENNSNSVVEKGALEKLFIMYDCNMNRPDVAAGLIGELSRCCSSIHGKEETKSTDGLKGAGDSSGSLSASSSPVRQSSMQSFEPEQMPLLRDVPAHLKELCAEALTGAMRSVFRNPTQFQKSISENDLGKIPLRCVKEQKILMRKAVELFNEKSTKGFQFLVTNGLISEPVTPDAIASFLRNGIVLGLDKKAVGEYLGTKGKSPVAGKSPPDWERDWFHKEALSSYCSSFHFSNQSLLDGLRMFLAAFRLPGEAQQIDRILQAFAESCGLQCVESQGGSLFSDDPKKASDAAYLLSFSIIMLNTDLHNDNIRQDRKMKVDDFVKNNSDYGRDITDPDKKLPREYLVEIYERIKEEQIRTEGEGADGIMTFERWKDVMRNSGQSESPYDEHHQSNYVADLVLSMIQEPILSAISGFWGVSSIGESVPYDHPQSGMLDVQGARFGMDLSLDIMAGLQNISHMELFQEFFVRVCQLSGLLNAYKSDGVERTISFVESVERQSAVVVVMKTAIEFGDFIGSKGWKCVLGILFELRDLKLLGGGTHIKHRSLIIESDPDLLRPDERRDWEMRLTKQCYEATGGRGGARSGGKQKKGLLGSMSRAIFGSESPERSPPIRSTEVVTSGKQFSPSEHGKEELVLWDDLAPSDEEDEFDPEEENQHFGAIHSFSLGEEFEKQLIREDHFDSQPAPVTGLETYEDTRVYQISPRARVRKRLSKLCDFSMILSETRFLGLEGVKAMLQALTEIISTDSSNGSPDEEIPLIISPGSEALAEVMITEIALKNRDRIAALWSSSLKSHYERRLAVKEGDDDLSKKILESVKRIPGTEKCLTGLLRICYHTVHRDGVNNEVLQKLKLLCPYSYSSTSPLPSLNFSKHIAEGLWRICRDVDGLRLVGTEGWEGIVELIKHCASSGQLLVLHENSKANNLSDDDPALQAFRCMHLILHSAELRDVIPFRIVHSVRSLISGGERQNCPKLSLAGLDLLLLLLTRLHLMANIGGTLKTGESMWTICWLPLIEGMAEASDSKFSAVRHHSISMLRDSLIDKYSEEAPIIELCSVLNGICMPIISQRISELVQHQTMLKFDQEEILIELELCISAIFKPFLHHLEKLSSDLGELTAVWMSLLSALSHLLGKETSENQTKKPNNNILKVTKDLATERLRDSVMILISRDILKCDDDIAQNGENGISSNTWKTLSSISYCKHLVPEWRESGKK